MHCSRRGWAYTQMLQFWSGTTRHRHDRHIDCSHQLCRKLHDNQTEGTMYFHAANDCCTEQVQTDAEPKGNCRGHTFFKKKFQERLEQHLNLIQVPSPVLLQEGTGINDNLNGIERIVSFDVLDMEEGQIEVVQSLAKWKRVALKTYGFQVGEGLYTNMNAIRRDEWMDNLHSIYVDQWDWEKVIAEDQRNLTTLKEEVSKIYRAIQATEQELYTQYSCLEPILPDQLFFITTQELENQYPDLTPKERENEITRQYGAVLSCR